MGLLHSKQQSYIIDNRSVTWKTYEEYCLYQIPHDDEVNDEKLNSSFKDEKSIREHLMIARPQRRRIVEQFTL